jgi:CRISPR/Cas system-associated exonuclease Cas4 (RecB family)|tara:strand:- start:3074 stop:4066 length:993 start_codon:yes stop_codon:yes gene_type:complete
MTKETDMKIKDAVMQGRSAIEARHAWGFDRKDYLNSSEAGDCIRKIWYAKHTPEDAAEQDWGFARRGSHGESYVTDSLAANNSVTLDMVGGNQRSLQDKQRRLSATPDGVLKIDDGEWEGLEIKTIDPRTNLRNLPKANHLIQFKIAMALVNQETEYTVSQGRLIYMDASNFNSITEFKIEADNSILDSYAKKAKRVFSAASPDSLDREGKRNGGCKFCSFTEVCGVSAPVRGQENAGGMTAAARRYVDIKDQVDRLKIEQDGLKEDLKSGLATLGKSTAIAGDIEVSIKQAKGRASLNRKAVTAAGIDLSPFETVGAPSERLSVQRKLG